MSPDWLQPMIEWLAANPGWLALAVFTIALIESLALAGILIPGMAILFAVTVLAGKAGAAVPVLLFWTAVGAILGDLLSFWLGRALKGRLHRVWPFSRYPALIRKAESLFVRHGGVSVLIGRFVGPVRPVLPMVAGAFSMPARHFLMFNVLSALIWAPFSILPGYAIGNTLASPVSIPPELYPVIAISGGALIAAYLLFFRVQLGLRHQSFTYRWIRSQLNRHPALDRLWQTCSSSRPGTPEEFPLASLSLAAAAMAGLLLWLMLTYTTGLPLAADRYFLAVATALQHPLGEQATRFVASLFPVWLLVAGLLLAATVLWLRGHYAAARHWLAGGIAAGAGVALVHRLPVPPMTTLEHGTSLPDPTTTLMALLTGLLAAFIAREAAPARRWRVYGLLSLPLLFSTLSRLYLMEVWFTEATTGLLLGLAVSGVTRTSFSRHDHQAIPSDMLTRGAVALWLVLGVLQLFWN